MTKRFKQETRRYQSLTSTWSNCDNHRCYQVQRISKQGGTLSANDKQPLFISAGDTWPLHFTPVYSYNVFEPLSVCVATTRVLLVSLDPSSSLQVISCGGQKEEWSRDQSILIERRLYILQPPLPSSSSLLSLLPPQWHFWERTGSFSSSPSFSLLLPPTRRRLYNPNLWEVCNHAGHTAGHNTPTLGGWLLIQEH